MQRLINIFFIFFCGIGGSLRKCPSVCVPNGANVRCNLRNKVVDCGASPRPETVALFKCKEYYVLEGEPAATCLANGNWSSTFPKCRPDCGRGGSAVSLIVNGQLSVRGQYPWQVALYQKTHDNYEFFCSGTLISQYAVLTAAHCTWQVLPEDLFLAFGKLSRNYYVEESGTQKIKAKKIEILDTYQDVLGNYNDDISVIFLEKAVNLNILVRPVCLDLDQSLMEDQLKEGIFGVVQGWGLTENDTYSDFLRVVNIPVVSNQHCITELEPNFKKFVSYTSLCAGLGNGTGVCNGDSGAGLSFFDAESGRWYVQGVVSLSPRKKGTPYCDLNFPTIFTKVNMFNVWLKKMRKVEEKMFSFTKCKENQEFTKVKQKETGSSFLFDTLFEKYNKERKSKVFIFPHSDKILQSAGILKSK